MKRAAAFALLVAFTALASSVAMCTSTGGNKSSENPDAAAPLHDGSGDALATDARDARIGDSGSDGDGKPLMPDAKPPVGWHRWEIPPEDCAIFVPDNLASVESLVWEPCPFQPAGCRRASWSIEGGKGFGGLIWVVRSGGSDYAMIPRFWTATDIEIILTKDDQIIAAWRYGPGSECSAGFWPGTDDRIVSLIHRFHAETSPWVLFNSLQSPSGTPDRIEYFGPPDAAVLPSNIVSRSKELLVVWEDSQRFGVRDLAAGTTVRPEPPDGPASYIYLERPAPVGRTVYYSSWNAKLTSVWAWRQDTGSVPVFKDDQYSYDQFVSDGSHAVWLRGSGQLGIGQFQKIDFFGSPIGESPASLVPKLLAADVGNYVVYSVVGEGWSALRLDDGKDVRLYRIDGGAAKRLPAVADVAWAAGQYQGMSIAGGAAWVLGLQYPPPPYARYLVRFDLSALLDL